MLKKALAITLLLVLLVCTPTCKADTIIESKDAYTEPVINGLISEREYYDANHNKITLYSSSGTITNVDYYIKNNEDFIYIAFRIPDPQLGNLMILRFKDSAGNTVAKHSKYDQDPWEMYWNGEEWVNRGSVSVVVSWGSYESYQIVEWKIPINSGQENDLSIRPGELVRFGVRYGLDTSYGYPESYSYVDPESWAWLHTQEPSRVKNGDFDDPFLRNPWQIPGWGSGGYLGGGSGILGIREGGIWQDVKIDEHSSLFFLVKPFPFESSVPLQVFIGQYMVFDEVYSSEDDEFGWSTIEIRFKEVMREHGLIPGIYELKFHVPSKIAFNDDQSSVPRIELDRVWIDDSRARGARIEEYRLEHYSTNQRILEWKSESNQLTQNAPVLAGNEYRLSFRINVRQTVDNAVLELRLSESILKKSMTVFWEIESVELPLKKDYNPTDRIIRFNHTMGVYRLSIVGDIDRALTSTGSGVVLHKPVDLTFITLWGPGGTLYDDITINVLGPSQCELKVENVYGVVSGSGKYTKGTTVSFSVTPVSIDVSTGVRNRFVGWSSYTPGGYNGKSNPASVILDNDIVQIANWETECWVEIDGGGGQTSRGSGWYKKGSLVNIEAFPPSNPIIVYHFKGWEGISGTQTDALLLIDSPMRITAVWSENYSRAYMIGGAGLVGSLLLAYRSNLIKKREQEKQAALDKENAAFNIIVSNMDIIYLDKLAEEVGLGKGQVRSILEMAVTEGKVSGHYSNANDAFITENYIRSYIIEKIGLHKDSDLNSGLTYPPYPGPC